jgi:hypothetical protein
MPDVWSQGSLRDAQGNDSSEATRQYEDEALMACLRTTEEKSEVPTKPLPKLLQESLILDSYPSGETPTRIYAAIEAELLGEGATPPEAAPLETAFGSDAERASGSWRSPVAGSRWASTARSRWVLAAGLLASALCAVLLVRWPRGVEGRAPRVVDSIHARAPNLPNARLRAGRPSDPKLAGGSTFSGAAGSPNATRTRQGLVRQAPY